MTIIFSEDFEGGSPGAPVTTSNTALDGVDGAPTFTDEYVVKGNLGFLTDGSTGLSRGALAHPPAAAYIQAFIYFVTVPSTNTPHHCVVPRQARCRHFAGGRPSVPLRGTTRFQ